MSERGGRDCAGLWRATRSRNHQDVEHRPPASTTHTPGHKTCSKTFMPTAGKIMRRPCGGASGWEERELGSEEGVAGREGVCGSMVVGGVVLCGRAGRWECGGAGRW